MLLQEVELNYIKYGASIKSLPALNIKEPKKIFVIQRSECTL